MNQPVGEAAMCSYEPRTIFGPSLAGHPAQCQGPGSLVPTHLPAVGAGQGAQLGANAFGEVLVPGRVPDCYLGLLLDPPSDKQPGRVLVVAPAALLHLVVPQPDGTVLYQLLTGHPDRAPGELVFVPDLTVELRAW
jgi:hypothetical protein